MEKDLFAPFGCGIYKPRAPDCNHYDAFYNYFWRQCDLKNDHLFAIIAKDISINTQKKAK